MTPPSLWHQPAFLKFWAAQTLSFFGSQVTLLALPLTAVLTLDASASQLGVLRAAATLPTLLVGLFVGVWVDRIRRRPLLIGADLGRALLLCTVPVAVAVDRLTVSYLYALALLLGLLTTVFDVAHTSFLPTLVTREQIVEGNSKLEVSRAASLIAGPGLAGALVQLVTAPVAIVVDALSFLASAALLGLIRAAERPLTTTGQRRNVWQEIGEGLRTVTRNRVLLSMAVSLCVFNLFYVAIDAIYVLYLVRDLGIEPGTLGLLLSVGSIGFPIGALLAAPTARRIGIGAAIVWGAVVSDAAFLLLPLAGEPRSLAIPLLIVAQFLFTLAVPVTVINQVSLRQAMIADRLLGRVNATMRVIGLAAAPVGALVGGWLGATIGLRPTLALGALGLQLGAIILLLSPVRLIRDTAAAEGAEAITTR